LKEHARRDEVVVATKAFFPLREGANQSGLSRKHLLDAIDASLRRLGLDYVDLYQIHRFDPHTPIDETMRTLDDIVRSGRARYIGASSMFAWQFARMLHVSERNGWEPFVSMQNHWNLAYREEEREMVPLCLAEGVGIIPWSPLARGFLVGNRRRGGGGETPRSNSDPFADALYFRDTDFDVVDRLREVATQRGDAPAQVALAWLLHKPGVTAPIIGASRMEHLDEAIAATDLALSVEEIARLEEPYVPHPVLGHS
jgi:aryl-alcohol dehydrogenase-like predicted oxidoreductase